MKSVALIMAFLSLLVCRPAAAERAAVLMPDADSGIKADLVELAQWLVADWLRERGVEPLMPQRAAPRLSAQLRACRTADCAPRYLKSLKSADYAVVTKLTRAGRGSDVRIEIVLVNGDGERYSRDWSVGEAVELAVDAALTHAYTAFLSAQSERSASRETAIRRQRAGLNAVAQSEPQPSDARVAIDPYVDEPERVSSVWNYIIGGTLLAGSVPLFVPPIYVASNHDDCIEEDDSGRCRSYDFGELSILELSLAGASLLTGAFFILFAPITVEGELSAGDGQGFIRLRGSF